MKNARILLQLIVLIREGQIMAVTVGGFVKNGVVVPNAPLPEGAQVEIRLNDRAASVPAKRKDELAGDVPVSEARLSMLEFLESLPPGPRAFKTWEDYDQHLREEKNAWDR
jgi:hypothetical protein